MFKKSLLGMVAASAVLFAAGAANATIQGYNTAAAFVAGATGSQAPLNQVADQVNWAVFDNTLGQPSNNGTIPTGSQMTTTAGETVTVTNSSTNQKAFTTYTEGAGLWNGNFANGTTVLYNFNALSTTLSFATALSGVGVDLQTKLAGNYTFTLTAMDSNHNVIGSYTSVTGTSSGTSATNGTSHEGTVTFAGLTSTSANISFVTITASPNTLGFAIDTSLIYHTNINGTGGTTGGTQTPEPGTLGLLGAGLAGLGWVRRRRSQA
jgi:hypothetical protein